MALPKVELEPGFMVVTDDFGRRTSYPIAANVRAEDVPTGITYVQVAAVKTLANLLAVLIRTLIDRGVLDESFMEDDDYDLDHIIYAIEQMGGTYHEPDITVE